MLSAFDTLSFKISLSFPFGLIVNTTLPFFSTAHSWSSTSIIISDPAFQTYNQIQVTHTEKKQKILAIEGLKHMANNYKACLHRKRSVIVEVENMFYNKDQIEMYVQDEDLVPEHKMVQR